MGRGLVTMFFLMIAIAISAQTKKADSLRADLRSSKSDTSRINALNALGWELKIKNADTSLLLIDQALTLADKIHWRKGLGRAYHYKAWVNYLLGNFNACIEINLKAMNEWNLLEKEENGRFANFALNRKVSTLNNLGVAYADMGEYDKARKCYMDAMEISRKVGDKIKVATMLGNLGNLAAFNGNYKEAIEYYSKALQMAQEENNKAGISLHTGNMGAAYLRLSDHSKALEYFLKALAIDEELGDEVGVSRHYSNIGLIYDAKGDDQKALEYYKKALALNKKRGDKASIALVLGNMGTVYYENEENEKALENYQKALEIGIQIGDQAGVSRYLSNIGDVFVNLNRLDEALANYQRSLIMDEELGDRHGVALMNGSLGTCYLKMKDYQKSESYFKRSLEDALALGAKEVQKHAYAGLTEIYSATGRYVEALEQYKNQIAARDSLFNEENTKQQTRLEMQYEFGKKEASVKAEQEKKDALDAAEKKRQTIVLWSISGCGVLVLVFAVFAWRSFLQKKKVNEEIIAQKEIIEEKQKEILDSIYYARRIQRSLLTNDQYIDKNLKRLKRV